MSFIPQVICRNCGKKFSAIRGRCPACGTRHVKQTMRTAPVTSSGGSQAAASAKWQLIFGAILVAAVIVAVIILITASLDPVTADGDQVDVPPPVGITSPPPPTPTPTPSPSPTVAVTTLTITVFGSEAPSSFTQRTDWAPLPLAASVYPVEALATATVTWRSSDTSVATVDENGLLTAVGNGQCDIIAECGGLTASCRVLVPG